MADEEKAKAEKLAAAKKRVRIQLSNLIVSVESTAKSRSFTGRANEKAETEEGWCQEGG